MGHKSSHVFFPVKHLNKVVWISLCLIREGPFIISSLAYPLNHYQPSHSKCQLRLQLPITLYDLILLECLASGDIDNGGQTESLRLSILEHGQRRANKWRTVSCYTLQQQKKSINELVIEIKRIWVAVSCYGQKQRENEISLLKYQENKYRAILQFFFCYINIFWLTKYFLVVVQVLKLHLP